MKRFRYPSLAIFAAAFLSLSATLAADDRVSQKLRLQGEKEVTVFVTGSLIPQRIKLRRIGSTTTSPLRVIDRVEISQSGRVSTSGAFVNEPSVRIIGR